MPHQKETVEFRPDAFRTAVIMALLAGATRKSGRRQLERAAAMAEEACARARITRLGEPAMPADLMASLESARAFLQAVAQAAQRL